MKRPVALFGLCYLTVQILAFFVPQVALLLLAAILLAIFIILKLKHNKLWQHTCLIMIAIITALIMRNVYTNVVINPVLKLNNQRHIVTAVVREVNESYYDNNFYTKLEIKSISGENQLTKVYASANLPNCKVGDIVSFSSVFSTYEINNTNRTKIEKQIYASLNEISQFEIIDQSKSLWFYAYKAKMYISGNIKSYITSGSGDILSAIAIGDRTNLDDNIVSLFQKAGFSHLIVVSGLHLSLVTGMAYTVFSLFFRRRKAALFTVFVAVAFAFVTGFTPSVSRATTVIVLCYMAQVLFKRSDSLTSLSIAALVLSIFNPYCATSMSFLLSFSATFGVLCANEFLTEAKHRRENNNEETKFYHKIINIVAIPLASCIATFPILSIFGMGVSIVGIFTNVIAVFVLPTIVIASLIVGLLGGLAIFEIIVGLAGFVALMGIQVLYAMAMFVEDLPGAFVYISGATVIATVLATVLLCYIGFKKHLNYRLILTVAATFILLCGGTYFSLSKNVTKVVCVGSGVDTCLVIMQQLNTAVIYRGGASNTVQIQNLLKKNNIDYVDFVVDLRNNADEEKLKNALNAKEVVTTKNLIYGATYEPFGNVFITAKKQKTSTLAIVDLNGLTIGICVGKLNTRDYAMCDIFLVGEGEITEFFSEVLWVPSKTPKWLLSRSVGDNIVVKTSPYLQFRKNTSILWKEYYFDFT